LAFAIEFDGRRTLVTGAGQGVGRGIARSLARAGSTVVVNDVRPDRADAVVEEIRAEGGRAEAAIFDVTSFEEVLAATDRLGPFWALVNNAGNAGTERFALTPFVETDPTDWDRYFAINLYGVLNCTRGVLPGMIERQEGRIVTIVSDAGRRGEPYMSAYAAAKAGAAGFSRAVAREVGRYGITVNNVALGSMATPTDLFPEASEEMAERRARRLRDYVIRRFGTPEDVAGLVTYLASPLASWITGQTYPVNGGYTMGQ